MPYQRYARILSTVVTLGLVYLITTAYPPGWLIQLVAGLATLVFSAFVLDVYFLVRAYQRGEIFIFKNGSFWFSLIVLVIMGVMLFLDTGRLWWWFFYPVVLFQTVNNLLHLRLDDISMTVRMAYGKKLEIPFFSIDSVVVKEDFIEATLVEGQQIQLNRKQFFSSDWQRLRNRMSTLEK